MTYPTDEQVEAALAKCTDALGNPLVTADAIRAALTAAAMTREEVERETLEALALMFEKGVLTEENSIQRDVPGVVRAQDSRSLALLRSQIDKND